MFARRKREWSRRLKPVGAVGQLLHADGSSGSGGLFSYVFFEPAFMNELIDLAAKDARAWLDSPRGGDIWEHGPLP